MSSTILLSLGSDEVAGGGGGDVEVDASAAAVASHLLEEPARGLDGEAKAGQSKARPRLRIATYWFTRETRDAARKAKEHRLCACVGH